MSMNYKGGIISATPPTTSSSSASGVWTLQQQMQAIAASAWPFPIPPDPYFNQTTLLLHGNGTNGAQNNTFLDSSTNNFAITRNGNTTQGTFSPYGSNWGNYFDGTGDYLTVPDNAAFTLPADFTIECWFFQTGAFQDRLIIDKWPEYYIYTRANGVIGLAWGPYNASGMFGVGGIVQSGSNGFALNAWTHVAAVRSSNTFTLYINGVSISTATNSATVTDSSSGITIGDYGGGGGYAFEGYVSNARIVKGTAVYTANFIPSTTPLTAITNTSLLTCQSNRFIDNSTNNFTITPTGSVSVQRFSPFAPSAAYSASTIGGSGYFDGSGDYLSLADNTAFTVGTGDLTIEAWIYVTSLTQTYQGIMSGRVEAASYAGLGLVIDASKITFTISNYLSALTDTTNVPTNQWVHVVGVRSGTSAALFVNGVRKVLATNSENGTSNAMRVGRFYTVTDNYYFNGYISNARLVKGTAVYDPTQTTLTIPTAPLTNITNTSLLTNFTNAGILDNAMMNDLETVGNAQISTAQSKFGGGSMYFDGTGDYLVTPSSPSNTLGSGDFTVEFWAYPSNTSSAYRAIVSSENYNGTTGGWSVYQNGTSVEVWLTSGQVINATSALTASVWQHVALSRSSGTLRLFVNGTSISSTANSVEWTGQKIWIGDNNYSGTDYFYDGYIDDLRITKGIARYTANFTPPATEFSNL